MALPAFGQVKPAPQPKKKEPKQYDPVAWNTMCHKWHCQRWDECRDIKSRCQYASLAYDKALMLGRYHQEASFYHWERLQALKAQQPE